MLNLLDCVLHSAWLVVVVSRRANTATSRQLAAVPSMLASVLSAVAMQASVLSTAARPGGTYALLGVAASTNGGAAPVTARIGTVRKWAGNPLLKQTRVWEANTNNGYPTVLYDADAPDSGGGQRIIAVTACYLSKAVAMISWLSR